MKIIHLVGWYFPESRGGSEVYVEALAREQAKMGHEVLVAAPHDGADEKFYHHETIPVYRYPAGIASAERLAEWMTGEKPDAAHFHSWTAGLNHEHMKQARELGARVYWTVHTASPFCARGTMMRWDREVCDGEMRLWRCAACYLHKRGLGQASAMFVSALGSELPFASRMVPGRLRTALELPLSVRARREHLQEAWSHCHKVVAVCQWVRDALQVNGCPEEKLALVRQGVSWTDADIEKANGPSKGALRLGYLGRLDPVKGVMLLVDAFCRLPSRLEVKLELKGIPHSREYAEELDRRIGNDARIERLPPSGTDGVRAWLRTIDVLVAPSLWMESGPLTVYEALAMKAPVIGSNHGGIAELVQDGVNGFLFMRGSVEDLHRILLRICETPTLLNGLREKISPARTMRDVMIEMERVYQ